MLFGKLIHNDVFLQPTDPVYSALCIRAQGLEDLN